MEITRHLFYVHTDKPLAERLIYDLPIPENKDCDEEATDPLASVVFPNQGEISHGSPQSLIATGDFLQGKDRLVYQGCYRYKSDGEPHGTQFWGIITLT